MNVAKHLSTRYKPLLAQGICDLRTNQLRAFSVLGCFMCYTSDKNVYNIHLEFQWT